MNLRIWSVVMVVSMCIVFLAPTVSMNASAFSGGDGSVGDPYVITDVWGLQSMNTDVGAHYVLGNDINASITSGWNGGLGFVPIGSSSNRFAGSLDGDNYTISNLFINRPALENVGLFGFIGYGVGGVENVGLIDVSITGAFTVGGLAGFNGGIISNCYASGGVTGVVNTGVGIGGLVAYSSGKIYNSYSSIDITGLEALGGLVGYNYGDIYYSYATGNISGEHYLSYYANNIGGLVGSNHVGIYYSYATGNISGEGSLGSLVGYTSGTVHNSYAIGSVTRSSGTSSALGGFVGWVYRAEIINCYSIGEVIYVGATNPTDKGFCGYVESTGEVMTGNYWDMDTSNQTSTSGNAMGENTSAMMDKDTFVGWDIVDIMNHDNETWYIRDGEEYPRLGWQEYEFTPVESLLKNLYAMLPLIVLLMFFIAIAGLIGFKSR